METSLETLERSIRKMMEDLRMTKEKNGYDFVSLLNLMEIVKEISRLREKEIKDLNEAFKTGIEIGPSGERIDYYSEIFKEKN